MLDHEYICHQISTDDKEDVNTQEPATKRLKPSVEQYNCRNSYGSKAIDLRTVSTRIIMEPLTHPMRPASFS